jgi:mRNA interferase RelE/StbE
MKQVWHVELAARALADLRGLDQSERLLVEKGIEKLKTDPQMRGHALQGNLADFRSLVVGKRKIRIIYRIVESKVLVHVIAIGHRRNKEVYIEASTRTGDSPSQ